MIKNNKAQISIFFIFGIILLSASMLIYNIRVKDYSSQSTILNIDNLPFEFRPLLTFIEQCIRQKTQEVAYIIAAYGGNLYPDKDFLITHLSSTNYYIKDNMDVSPSKIEIEESFNEYLRDNLHLCIRNFDEFRIQGYNITDSGLVFNTTLSPDRIYEVLKKGFAVEKDGSKINLENIQIIENIRLGEMHSLAKEIAFREQMKQNIDPFMISNSDYDLSVFPYDDKTTIYSILDKNSASTKPFLFIFAIKKIVNMPPSIDLINDQMLEIGETLNYTVFAFDPEYDTLTYSTDSEFLRVDSETGEVSFTSKDEGKYTANLIVEDAKGARSSRQITIYVRKKKGLIDIEPIGKLVIPVGKLFTYNLNTLVHVDEPVKYSVDSPLIDINEDTGILSFTPISKGSYLIKVRAEDSNGNYDEEEIDFEIIGDSKLIIEPIGELHGKVNNMFSYQVKVISGNDYSVKYSDNSTMFDITKEGKINFIPTKIGIISIEIKIANFFGDYSTEIMRLIIENE